jgi:hypothetical protein
MQETKPTLAIYSNSCAHWVFPQKTENLYPYRNLHMEVCSSSSHAAETKRQPKCPLVSEWHTQTMEYYLALNSH